MEFRFTDLRKKETLAANAGLLGAIMIGVSFAINPGPAAGTSGQELIAFGQQHFSAIMWGAWLQAVGPLLIVFFALSLVHLAGAKERIEGWMTMMGAGILMMVSLTEVVFYIGALHTNPEAMAQISVDLAQAVQHLYFIVAAPALFLPVGLVLLSSTLLPRIFGYLAIGLAALFFVVGILSLQLLVLPPAITAIAAVQAFWWVAAALALKKRAKNFS